MINSASNAMMMMMMNVIKRLMFRRRHQTLSRAVSKVDGFMRFCNVAGFVCHILNTILLLYSVIFHPDSRKTVMSALSFAFWLYANIDGLFFSASSGVMVNHMVSAVHVSCALYKTILSVTDR